MCLHFVPVQSGSAFMWLSSACINWLYRLFYHSQTINYRRQRIKVPSGWTMAPDIADPSVDPTSHQCSSNTSTSCTAPSVVQQRIVSSDTKANLVRSKDDNNNQIEPKENATSEEFRPQIRWPDFFAQLFLHLGFLIGLWYVVTLQAKLYTVLWSEYFLSYVSS